MFQNNVRVLYISTAQKIELGHFQPILKFVLYLKKTKIAMLLLMGYCAEARYSDH